MDQQLASLDNLANGLYAWYDFTRPDAQGVENLVPSLAKRLTLASQTWKPSADPRWPLALWCDNTADTADAISLTGGDFWRQSLAEMSILFIGTLELTTVGPLMVFERGGRFDGGLALAYKKTPQKFAVRFGGGSGALTELSSSRVITEDPSTHVVAATFDRGTVNLYVDGEVDSSSTGLSQLPATTQTARFVGRTDDPFFTGGDEWGGRVYCLAFWNRALGIDEIRRLQLDPWYLFRRPQPIPARWYVDGYSVVQRRYDEEIAFTVRIPNEGLVNMATHVEGWLVEALVETDAQVTVKLFDTLNLDRFWGRMVNIGPGSVAKDMTRNLENRGELPTLLADMHRLEVDGPAGSTVTIVLRLRPREGLFTTN